MPFVNVWIHVVFSTKKREPILRSAIRPLIFQHILTYNREKEIYIDSINGYTDHVHLLVSLKSTQTIADVMKAIKGESSNWINKQQIIEGDFRWQNDYFAVSVSQSHLERVRRYIFGQEDHHSQQSYYEEMAKFGEHYGAPMHWLSD